MLRILAASSIAAAAAFSPAPLSAHRAAAVQPSASPVMMEEGATSRRVLLASLLAAVPAAANAMTVPGLNGPGLVPAKKVGAKALYGDDFGGKTVTGDFDYVRDSKINHFWNDNGIVNSVPKMKGIITPKSPTIPGGPGGFTQDKL